MRSRRALLGAILVATLFFGAAAASAAARLPPSDGPATTAHPGAAETLTVSVGDAFSFSLSTTQITPGDLVTITLVSLGDVAHTFTLSPIPNFQFNSSDSTAHLQAFFATHQPLVNLSENGTIGEKHSE